ncbi:MAG: class I SAM-dependent methyltransferase [Candidatus Margulisiibacteriota bacterium]|jgi:SAM-dependent methyltransferase
MKVPVTNFGPRLCRPAFAAAINELSAFRPKEFCREAADRIAQAQGFPSHSAIKIYHSDKLSIIKEMIEEEQLLDIVKQLSQAQIMMQLATPANSDFSFQSFGPIEMARRLIFLGQKPVGIQLASNWGLYPLFLKEAIGLTGFSGIDCDPHAVAFAREIGAPVKEADARALPFPDGSLDLIISSHFLDHSYISLIDRLNHLSGHYTEDFQTTVRREIIRVLKPGGWFLTQTEVLSEADLTTSWRENISQLATFNFGKEVHFDNLFAAQKG